jgi:hypothetical protein
VGEKWISPRLVELVFLNRLPKGCESSRQLLEFHAKTWGQMVRTLSAAETYMKDKTETIYGMDTATVEKLDIYRDIASKQNKDWGNLMKTRLAISQQHGRE